MSTTFANKKTYPMKYNWNTSLNTLFDLYTQTAKIYNKKLAPQELWYTLHLVWGRLSGCRFLEQMRSLMDPQESVPKELFIGLQKDVGVFPIRVVELIRALSGNQIPSFGELLTIFCGGSLCQTCSFCKAKMIVHAVNGEFKGAHRFKGLRVPTVTIVPFLPPLYSCGSEKCDKEIDTEENIYRKLYTGLALTHLRLRPSMCDYCFMLPEKAHRYNMVGYPLI